MQCLLDRFPPEYDKLPIEALEKAIKSDKFQGKTMDMLAGIMTKKIQVRKKIAELVIADSNAQVCCFFFFF